MEHYYARNPEVKSNPQSWATVLRDHSFRFKTDLGVFSKAEVDFGSRLLTDTFVEPSVAGPVLDVGCGYGPIGLSIAKDFPERQIHMIDVNLRAISLAQENAELNNLTNVEIYESEVFNRVNESGFAAIVTNPPIRAGKVVVHQILEQSYLHLVSGGQLWVVIQKKQGAPSAQHKMKEVFGNVETVAKKKGYYILRSLKD